MPIDAEWILKPAPAATADLIASGVDPSLAPLFARRGLRDLESVESFLHPSATRLHDPYLLLNMEPAIERLMAARADGERVAIVGDYDVDGVSATALLAAVFKICGLDIETILPNRLQDGYGFQGVHVDRAREAGCAVIVTVDCGTTSIEAVAEARVQGLDVIVADHHQLADQVPDCLLINPNQEACSYPFGELSGAGLALKLGTALMQRCELPVPLESLLRVACLGTIADVVALVEENRIIASLGLAALETAKSVGLRALMRSARLSPPFRADDVGFRLGPRLNAAGRLGSADQALELLLTRSVQRARELARQLEECNQERQVEERRIVDEARELFSQRQPTPGILVGWSSAWHRGVVGIAAARISREFHRPTLLLGVEDGTATGSGRSIPGVDLYRFLLPSRGRMVRFGGHPQAVGLTVESAHLKGLRDDWENEAQWPKEVLVRRWDYEIELSAAGVPDLHEKLASFHPHGSGNRQPLIRLAPLRLDAKPRIFGRGHVKAEAVGDDGASVLLLGWNWAGRLEDLEDRFEVLAHLGWDSYDKRPVMEIRAARPLQPLDAAQELV